ncbi:unnamed protein product [Rotaria sp. Silwood2]|nr:unnamed protein product [Rotaria sp. Silwood2]CAF4520526.1 unnamed protein product [Rotaria sp. Silwood2]
MKILLYFIPFILWCYFSECEQPNFPPQIVFSPGNGQTIIAIDEINQRAYQSIHVYPSKTQASFAMKNFPYSVPDSLQSKYYVELVIDPLMNTYAYETYLKYGGNNFNVFPSHWLLNGSSLEIKNNVNFTYQVILL